MVADPHFEEWGFIPKAQGKGRGRYLVHFFFSIKRYLVGIAPLSKLMSGILFH
jgi:hypothetical protein